MKILLLHPEDTLEAGPWSRSRWDLVVDLGWSGREEYAHQAQLCERILSIYDFAKGPLFGDRLRNTLSLPLNRLVDSRSIDWWDAYCGFAYPKLEQLLLCSALAHEIAEIIAKNNSIEIAATRPHRYLLLMFPHFGRQIQILSPDSTNAGLSRALKSSVSLRPSQLLEIALDKWDIDYSLRRHFAPRRQSSPTPVILLPSSYSNVTRTQVAFARMVPNRQFLLVFTRRNGLLPDLPRNVESCSLASYASAPARETHNEFLHLQSLWRDLLREISEANPIFHLANQSHEFAGFEHFLRTGLRIRDTWLQVLAREPVLSILSADENNPYSRLPILLAKQKKMRTVFSDHGALNMTFLIRPAVSDLYLMRSEMALDYTTGEKKIPVKKTLLGVPRAIETENRAPAHSSRDRIVFYSEAYELYSSRTRIFYGELLPQLCHLARSTNCKVIVKLHPFESERERAGLIHQVLSPNEHSLVEIRTGPMTPDLFSRASCSFTVESSVAVESTLAGVPCFLCRWFDASWYEYAKQFAKFGAGYPLDSPEQIREIPQLLEKLPIEENTRRRLRTSIDSEQLESILKGSYFTHRNGRRLTSNDL